MLFYNVHLSIWLRWILCLGDIFSFLSWYVKIKTIFLTALYLDQDQEKNIIFNNFFLSRSRLRKTIFSTATNRIIIRKVTNDVIHDNQYIAFLFQMYKMISWKLRRNFKLFENWEKISNFLKTEKKFQSYFRFSIRHSSTSILNLSKCIFQKKSTNCIFAECTRQLAYVQSFASLFYPGITSLCICNYIDIFV